MNHEDLRESNVILESIDILNNLIRELKLNRLFIHISIDYSRPYSIFLRLLDEDNFTLETELSTISFLRKKQFELRVKEFLINTLTFYFREKLFKEIKHDNK